jgi:hypothetical protein
MTRSTFAVPLLLALLSLGGLVLALTGDGWRDQLSWALLAAPVIAVAWSAARRSERIQK